jgi:Zn-ribbon putative nucleic-acid-binding protein DUF2310
MHVPVYYYLSKHFGRSDRAERKRKCPSCGKAWLRKEPLHRIFDFHCQRCRPLSNVAFDVRLGMYRAEGNVERRERFTCVRRHWRRCDVTVT